MKKIKFISTLMLLITLGLSTALAQEKTLDGIGRNALRNSGTIVEKNIIKGYYYFYLSDKASKKTSNFKLVILDENLNEIVSKTMEEPNSTYLLESAYNGNSILFKFFDSKNKMVAYRTVDKEGNLSKRTERESNKQEVMTYLQNVQQELENSNVHKATDKYFADIHLFKDKGFKYRMECVDNNGKNVFTYAPEGTKGVYTGQFLTSDKNQILLLESHAKNIMSKDYSFKVLSVNYDGEKNFDLEMETNKYNLLPHSAIISKSGEITIFGDYFDIKDKSLKAESMGIFIKKVSNDGDNISENFISWSKDVSPKIPANKKKDVKSFHTYFQNIVVSESGKIIIIAEQYKKQVSSIGVAANVLAAASGNVNSDASNFEIKIGEILLITLDNQEELESVKVLEKAQRKVFLEKGYGVISQHLLARVLDASGNFDYSFTQTNEEKSVISIGYTSLEKQDGKLLKKYVFKIATYTDGEEEVSLDEMNFETKATAIRYSAAKPGFILVAEYYKKEKTLELRLEPINR